MKSLRLTFCFALLFAVFGAGAAVDVSAKDGWLKVRSKNFELVGNAEEKEMRRVATKLELFRDVFSQLLPRKNFNSPVPTRVVVFKDENSFQNFRPSNINGKARDLGAGYFQPGDEINYIALSTEGESDETFRPIFHEYTHFLIENSLGRSMIPPWLSEGLAEYYEKISIKDEKKITLGGLNSNHLLLLQQNKLIPFELFFNNDYYSLQSQTKETAGLFQAQSWALLHYLLQENGGAKSEQLNQFIELLLQGKNQKPSFIQAFQTDYQTMESELKQYLEQRKFAANTNFFTKKLDFEVETQSFPLFESEAKAIQGDLLYHTNRLADAEKVLLEALKLDANSSLANVTLGLLKMRERDFVEAKNYFDKATKADGQNYLAHYGSALVLSREEMIGFGFVAGYTSAQAEKMRENLRKTISLNPNFAESYHLFAFINFVRNEQINEGFEMIEKALQIAPGNQWYLLRKAQLLMRKENFTEARRLTLKVIPTAPDDRLKVYAENVLSVIDSLEAQLLSLKLQKYKIPDDGVITDEPVSEEELRRRREKATIESLNMALRTPDRTEKRILGFVTKIECRSEGIIVFVKTDNQSLRLRTDSFNNLTLTAYDIESVSTQFGCGTVKKETFSVITYRPPADGNAKALGEVIAIEFVPRYFKFVGKTK